MTTIEENASDESANNLNATPESYPIQKPSIFDRLSSELISEIFFCAIQLNPPRLSYTANYASIHSFETGWYLSNPLYLCAVCTLWRSIAFSTPRLWTELRLRFKRALGNGQERQLFHEWVDRAGALPLSLCMYEAFSGPELVPSDAWELRGDVLAVFPRCRLIELNLRLAGMNAWQLRQEHVDEALAGGMPLLEDIRFKYYSGPGGLAGCPNLRTLSRVSFCLLRASTFDNPAYTSLQHLDVAIAPFTAYQILQHFPLLKVCILRITGAGATRDMLDLNLPHPPTKPLVLTHLERLYLRCTTDISPLWKHLCFPSLKTAAISKDERFNQGNDFWEAIFECLSRSRPPLEELAFSFRADVTDEEVIEMLSWMSSLKRLDMCFWQSSPTNRFLDALCGGNTEPLCPALQSLHLKPCLDMEPTSIAGLIHARFRQSNTPSAPWQTLEYLTIDPCPFSARELLATSWMSNIAESYPTGMYSRGIVGVKSRCARGTDFETLKSLTSPPFGM